MTHTPHIRPKYMGLAAQGIGSSLGMRANGFPKQTPVDAGAIATL